jgi:hypothetical protein
VAWQTFLAGLSAGDSVGLTIPDAAHGGASTYILAAGLDHTSFAPGILGGITININCQNVNLDGDFFLGNIDGETGLYALAQTISPGATSAVVSDIQSGGDPPNNRLLEFRQITAINSGTSTISWSGPVVNTYKSTWPFYSHLAPFGGGPATINTLPTYNPTRTSGFDAVVTYNNTGGTIKCNGGANQLYPKVRQITMIGGTMTNFSPTQSQSIALVGCNMGANVMEQDKFVGTFTSTGCTYPGAVACQSGTGEYSFTGDTVNGAFNGTPGKLTLNNCVLNDQFQFGPSGYGFTEEVHFINTAFNGAIQQNIIGDLVSAWDWQGGGIFRTNDPTPGDTLKPLLWIGGYFYYQGTGGRAYGHTFQVTDAWQSGGFTFKQLCRLSRRSTWAAADFHNQILTGASRLTGFMLLA